MLTSDETFDHPGDTPLLLDVDERFELHRSRKGSKGGENLWVCWGLESIGFGVDADGFARCSGINQIR